MDVTGNWFPLHDPDQMKIPTPRMIEQGRQVVELREALACIHDHTGSIARATSSGSGRASIRSRQMLPMQTLEVRVPYENTLGGFQLFQQGVTSLVPALNGFEGADSISKASQGTDLILFGKHFSVQETNVVVGGVYLLLANLDNPTAASSSPPAGGDSSGSAQSGAAKSSTTAGAAKAPTPPAASNPGTTSSNPAIDIVSREVMRIHLPANVKPTDIYDADRKTSRAYVEIYVATPTGISNRLLVPYKKAKDADAKSVTAQVGFDLNAKDSAEMDVSVQWIHDADDRYSLVASEDPSAGDKKPLHITWDSPVGFAPGRCSPPSRGP